MDNYIRKLSIKSLFGDQNDLTINFVEKINCIYGANGSGKTTIINLLVASLYCDVAKLHSISFEKVSIFTAPTNKRRAVLFLEVIKYPDGRIEYSFPDVEEGVYEFRHELRRVPNSDDDSGKTAVLSLIRNHISTTYVPLSRMQDSEAYDLERPDEIYLSQALRSRHVSPDEIEDILDPSRRMLTRLERLFKQRYSQTQDEINKGLDSLKNTILGKMLLDKKYANTLATRSVSISKVFYRPNYEYEELAQKLKSANIDIEESALREHFGIMEETVNELNHLSQLYTTKKVNGEESAAKEVLDHYSTAARTYRALFPIYDRFLSILKDIEGIEIEKEKALKPFTQTKELINSFLINKIFSFSQLGGFEIRCGQRQLKLSDLSSGEKHMIALLGRVALSPKEGAVFVADEPELSLHLEWQRKIIPSIIELSPGIQVIVATHSPAIIPESANMIDLEDCVK